jgi:hypothetical protein
VNLELPSVRLRDGREGSGVAAVHGGDVASLIGFCGS